MTVDPPSIKELFQFYAFCVSLSNELLDRAAPQINTPEFGELLGMTSAAGQAAGRLATRVADIRGTHPLLFEVWEAAIEAARKDEA